MSDHALISFATKVKTNVDLRAICANDKCADVDDQCEVANNTALIYTHTILTNTKMACSWNKLTRTSFLSQSGGSWCHDCP